MKNFDFNYAPVAECKVCDFVCWLVGVNPQETTLDNAVVKNYILYSYYYDYVGLDENESHADPENISAIWDTKVSVLQSKYDAFSGVYYWKLCAENNNVVLSGQCIDPVLS